MSLLAIAVIKVEPEQMDPEGLGQANQAGFSEAAEKVCIDADRFPQRLGVSDESIHLLKRSAKGAEDGRR